MRKRTIRFSLLALTLLGMNTLWTSTASAQGVLAEETGDGWRSSLFLYLWATGLDGTVGVGGQEVEIDESFSDLLENLDGAFSARFESHKGKWGYFLDGMYVKLDPSQATPIGTVSLDVKNFIFEVGGVYHFNQHVQALFGGRYQDMDVDLNLPVGTVGGGQNWTDGFIGARLVPVNTDKWRIWLRGDVGVVGDSDTTWNAAVGAGYLFNERWSAVLAYRVLSTDIVQNGFKWDVEYSGLGLAVGYTFR